MHVCFIAAPFRVLACLPLFLFIFPSPSIGLTAPFFSGLWGDKFMREGDGFLCVYSITAKSSFEELEVFRDQILRAKDVDKVPPVTFLSLASICYAHTIF